MRPKDLSPVISTGAEGRRKRGSSLLQTRSLEKSVAIRRFDPQPNRAAVAEDFDGDFTSRRAARPDLAVKIAEPSDALIAHRPDHVARLHAGGRGGPFLGN